jgi:hypothetical protein
MKYCKSTKHEFKLSWNKGKIVWACQNCRCKKINHEATKRFNDNVRDFGTETAMKLSGF